jgi:hypothetical protein
MELKGNKKTVANKKAMIQALELSLGIVSKAIRTLGTINRSTYYDWLKDDSVFKSEVNYMLELKRDYVESKMMELIENNNAQAIIEANKTLNKSRGYGNSVDITSDDAPITISINI